jgi:hypothetical protein
VHGRLGIDDEVINGEIISFLAFIVKRKVENRITMRPPERLMVA